MKIHWKRLITLYVILIAAATSLDLLGYGSFERGLLLGCGIALVGYKIWPVFE